MKILRAISFIVIIIGIICLAASMVTVDPLQTTLSQIAIYSIIGGAIFLIVCNVQKK